MIWTDENLSNAYPSKRRKDVLRTRSALTRTEHLRGTPTQQESCTTGLLQTLSASLIPRLLTTGTKHSGLAKASDTLPRNLSSSCYHQQEHCSSITVHILSIFRTEPESYLPAMLFKTNLTSASACWAFPLSPPDPPRKLFQLCCGPPRRPVLCFPAELANGNQSRQELEVFTPLDSLCWGTGRQWLLIRVTFSSSYTLQIPETTLSFVPSSLRVMVSPAAGPGLFHHALLVLPHLPSLCEYPRPPQPHCRRVPDD